MTMKRFVLWAFLIALVHFVLAAVVFGVAFSRGMNQAPIAWFDGVLWAGLGVLRLPLRLVLEWTLPVAVVNSLIWGGALAWGASRVRAFRRARAASVPGVTPGD